MKKLLTVALVGALLTGCQKHENKASNFTVNDKTSRAEWKCSATDHFHVGSFKVTGALAADESGNIKSGDFVIPIASIEDFDLPANVKPVLLADLKDNFFKILMNPDAKFHITSVAAYRKPDTAAVKGANYLLTGEFTMVGQTHTLSFPAKVAAKGDSLVAEAKFNIDRTKWGMVNYSDPSQKLYILPEVNIHLKMQSAKGNSNSQAVAMIATK
jgi:polyisoprenoid-binding protein YceI